MDLASAHKVSHIYFRYHCNTTDHKAFYLKIDFIHSVGEEFFLGENEQEAAELHRHLIERWALEK